MGRLLIVVGLVLAGVGALIMVGVPIGRLPGDLVLRRGSATIYLPFATCALFSILLTVIVAVLRR